MLHSLNVVYLHPLFGILLHRRCVHSLLFIYLFMKSFLYISMKLQLFILYFGLFSNTTLLILLLKLFQLCTFWGALSLSYCVPLLYPIFVGFLVGGTFLLSGTIRCSSLVLYIPRAALYPAFSPLALLFIGKWY